MAQLKVRINGKSVHFFRATVRFGIESLAHTFDISIEPMIINSPLPVEMFLDNTRIFSGQIDGTNDGVKENGESLRVFGRSRTANFIDSRISTDNLYNQTLEEIINTVGKQFGVKSVANTKLEKILDFQLTAESPLNNIVQAAKQQKLMLMERKGLISIEQPGQFAVRNIRLEEGLNITDLTLAKNWSGVHHRYEVQGAWDGSEGFATCDFVNSSRQIVVMADKLQDKASCKARAEFERDLAIAKSLTAAVTMPGLYHELADTAINRVVQLVSKQRGFNQKMLIKSIQLDSEESSESTKIELFKPFNELVL